MTRSRWQEWRPEMMHSASPVRSARALVIVLLLALAASAFAAHRPTPSLAGEWDVYIALSARPHFGFEGWRRMGFAHFAGADSGNVGLLRRRTGETMLNVTQVSANGDSVLLTQDAKVIMRAAWHGDTLVGVQFNEGRPLDRRFRLVRPAMPAGAAHHYHAWTMPASDAHDAAPHD